MRYNKDGADSRMDVIGRYESWLARSLVQLVIIGVYQFAVDWMSEAASLKGYLFNVNKVHAIRDNQNHQNRMNKSMC